MLKDFVPPAWVRQVVVVADAGFAANATLRLIAAKPLYVCLCDATPPEIYQWQTSP